jgi:predicted RNA-binding Zn ribbon-like protein
MQLRARAAAKANLVGGRLCLDFVNTVGGWQPAPANRKNAEIRDDRLNDYGDLLAWSWRAGLLTERAAQALAGEAERRATEAAAVWERACAMRQAIYQICQAIIQQRTPRPADLELLNEEINLAHGRVKLSTESAQFVWQWLDSNKALDQMLWRIADSAAEMLTTDDLTRLRQCPGEECGWLFADTSKNGRRQWCDMQDCGNLAKVRRFRVRRQEAL